MKPKPITIMSPLLPDRIKGRDIPGLELELAPAPKPELHEPEPEDDDQ